MTEIKRIAFTLILEGHTPHMPVPTQKTINRRTLAIAIIAGILIGGAVLTGATLWHLKTGHWVYKLGGYTKEGEPWGNNDWYPLPGKKAEFFTSLGMAIVGAPGAGVITGFTVYSLAHYYEARNIARINDSIAAKKNTLKTMGLKAQKESLNEQELDILLRSENGTLIAGIFHYLNHEELSLLKKKLSKEKFKQLALQNTSTLLTSVAAKLGQIATLDPNTTITPKDASEITKRLPPLLDNDKVLCMVLPFLRTVELTILRQEVGKIKLMALKKRFLELQKEKIAALREKLQALVSPKERLCHALEERERALPDDLKEHLGPSAMSVCKRRLARLTEEEIYAQMDTFHSADLTILKELVRESLAKEVGQLNAEIMRYTRIEWKTFVPQERGKVATAGSPERTDLVAALATDDACFEWLSHGFEADDIRTLTDILGEQEMTRLVQLQQSTDIVKQTNALPWEGTEVELVTALRAFDFKTLEETPSAKAFFFARAQLLPLARRLLIAKIYFDKTAQAIAPEGFVDVNEEGTYTTLNAGDSRYSTRYNMQWRLFPPKPSDTLFPNLDHPLDDDGTISLTNLVPHLPLEDQDRNGLLALLTFLNGPDREPTAAEVPSLLYNAYKHLDRFADEALSPIVRREEVLPN